MDTAQRLHDLVKELTQLLCQAPMWKLSDAEQRRMIDYLTNVVKTLEAAREKQQEL